MSANKRHRVKGQREVATLQTLVHADEPRNRHHLVTRFARLENEYARLERELEMWTTRRQATEDQYNKIKAMLGNVRSALLESGHRQQATGHTATTGKRHRPRASTEVAGSTAAPNRTMSLEY